MGAREPGSELREAPLSERRILERVGLVERSADPGPHRFRQMVEDVAPFVKLAAMDERGATAVRADCFAQPRPAVDDEEGRLTSPRSRRSASSAWQTVAFSVVPSRSARTCLAPSGAIPKAKRITWSRK